VTANEEGTRVLVAYGSKLGGTAGLAETVGDGLRRRGLTAEVRPAATVDSLEGYDAVIVGGALYAGRWHRDARRFVKRHARELRARPVWMFSSGPLGDDGQKPDVDRWSRAIANELRAGGHPQGEPPVDASGTR
jgi:menaquinone-dependent protoporphyrinogen oxidase